ncbi:CDP-glycerol glycerophosphotransferase family protein [Pediococcus pentosaceus]|uniref:CDP-glycerol glycerophosphotransferase family protein n=1 Tax=Pediococcus pentosaceus TaxID=1255 RepID=UPI00190BA769|nr:CDP-glycerol glycerophosphotransferase family protein [Pediococcus pentosaceus]MBF7124553.1 CDP-glycerol glycerophosphotransferase family protein [Pediococcus pentosaceus]WPK16392.1 CDP-glycerol glycerophosphotransferase family protein [Pediococcus pentosaceus]
MNVIKFLRKVKRRLLGYSFKINYRPYTHTTVIFESFGGRQISDSPLAIYKELKKTHPEYRLIWVVNKGLATQAEENGYDYVIRGSFKWVRTIEKAQIWVENARLPQWVRKPKHVKLIQTWHGTPLKKLGLDIKNVVMPGTNTERYHQNFVKEANRWDVLISPNTYSTNIFRQAFGYQNKIVEIGYPRNDKLANPTKEEIKLLKQKLGIPLDKKVIMYAPTYRDNQFFQKGKYSFELPFSLKEFQERFGSNAVLLLRMHYLIANSMDISGFEDFAYDVSSYTDISELYLVSDLLITDYSSVFFDYAYLKRPILFYPYDYEIYKDELRGFYLDYQKDLPGKIAYNSVDLYDEIENELKENDISNNQQFEMFYKRFCGLNAGNASKRIVEEIERNL